MAPITFRQALATTLRPAVRPELRKFSDVLSGFDDLDPRAADYAIERVARLGYDADAHNFGRVRCLLPHEHGSDERCRRIAEDVWIRAFDDPESGALALVAIARARTLSARPAPLCPQCGAHDAVAGFIDDLKDKIDSAKSDASLAWDICSVCRKIGATVGGSDDIITGADGFPIETSNVAGYHSRDPNRRPYEPDAPEGFPDLSGVDSGEQDKEFRRLAVAWNKVIAKLDASPADCACRATVEPLVASWREYSRDWSDPAGMREQWANLRQAQQVQGDPPTPDALRPGDLILDVRTPSEFETKHLEGAVNIPVDELNEDGNIPRIRDLANGNRIVVFCAGGMRAARAVHKLREAGLEACSGHKDPTCGCDPVEEAAEEDSAGALPPDYHGLVIVPGIRADDLLTKAQRVARMTFLQVMQRHLASPEQIRRALARGVLRRVGGPGVGGPVSGADPDAVAGKVAEIAAAWDGLRDRTRTDRRLAAAFVASGGKPFATWQGQLAGYRRTGEIDLSAALDNLGSWIPDAINPWAPSDEAKAKVAELAKKWPELEAKMQADPKIARALKPQHDHWIAWKATWDAGNADLNDLRMAIQDYDEAHANALGILTQNDPGRVADIASEKTSAARGAAQTVSDTADEAAKKAKEAADKAATTLDRYKWPILAATGALVLAVLRR